MPNLSVFTPAPGDEFPWRELLGSENLIYLQAQGSELSMLRIPKGTESGGSSVAIRIDLPDGKVVVVETTMKLFQMAAAAFRGAMERDGEEGV